MIRHLRWFTVLLLLAPGCGLLSGGQDDGAGSTALLVDNESDAELRILFADLGAASEEVEVFASPGELVPLANDSAIGYAPAPEEIIGSISITISADAASVLESTMVADLPWNFEGSGEYGSGQYTLLVTQELVDAAD